MTRKLLGLLLTLAVVTAACGEVGVKGGDTTTTPEPEPEPSEMLQIRSEGGFAPVEFILGNGPTYTLLTNGELIMAGPVPEIYPGPLLPNYQVVQLSEDQMAKIQKTLDEIGLARMIDDFDDSAASFVADATTEVITLWDENGTHRYSVYALGIGANPLDPDTPSDPRTKAFGELYGYLGTIDTSDATTYIPERVRVLAGTSHLQPEEEFVDIRDWPLGSENPETWAPINLDWMCTVLDSDVLSNFEDATRTTTWTLDGVEMLLLVRPLLPGEPDCPV